MKNGIKTLWPPGTGTGWLAASPCRAGAFSGRRESERNRKTMPTSSLPSPSLKPSAGAQSWVAKLGRLITGAADDDPSGIGTCSWAGAQFGFGMLWTLLLPIR